MKNLFILLAGALILASCNTSYEKTKSGLRYKIIKGKGGKQIKPGDFIQFNQIVVIPERDTVLFSTYGKMHGYDRVDTSERAKYTYMEVIPQCSVGDSLVIVLSVDSLVKRHVLQDYNNIFRRGGMLTFRMRITKSYATEAQLSVDAEKDRKAEEARMMAEMKEKSKQEIQEMEDYLKKNNIKTTKTPSGAYVEIQQQGTGPIGDTGAMAQVFYTGKLLKDGTVFDSNIDPKFGHAQAYPISLGMGSTVKGFDEGLMLFGKGGKGRIFVPAFLGYGASGSGPIPPNSALIFEVELRDITPKSAMPPGAASANP